MEKINFNSDGKIITIERLDENNKFSSMVMEFKTIDAWIDFGKQLIGLGKSPDVSGDTENG